MINEDIRKPIGPKLLVEDMSNIERQNAKKPKKKSKKRKGSDNNKESANPKAS